MLIAFALELMATAIASTQVLLPSLKGSLRLHTYCLAPDESLGITFGLTNVQLSSHDEGNGDDDTYSYAQGDSYRT